MSDEEIAKLEKAVWELSQFVVSRRGKEARAALRKASEVFDQVNILARDYRSMVASSEALLDCLNKSIEQTKLAVKYGQKHAHQAECLRKASLFYLRLLPQDISEDTLPC